MSTFIGDGLLVLFGTRHHNPWQPTVAANAALETQGRVHGLDEDVPGATLSLSIGVIGDRSWPASSGASR